MIIPSIDLMGGQTVQLVGGEEKVLDAGDPVAIAEQFRIAGEIAVVDLDAALGQGHNTELIERLLAVAECRVGGGVRDLETARRWLDLGATKVVIGTAATPEFLSQLPKQRVIAALDTKHGEVVVEGWRKATGHDVFTRIEALKEHVDGFLVTIVEREGRMSGTADLKLVERICEAAFPARVTIAGGITNADEIASLDRLGADAQVGMAIYKGQLDLADAIAAPLTSDREDGLWPTLVVNESGVALGLAYSDPESLRTAVRTRRGAYRSRKRGLWIKGDESGDIQELLRVDLDCDRDTLRFMVRQHGLGFCHQGTDTCFGNTGGIAALSRLLESRQRSAPQGSYTKRLFEDQELLASKIEEEARELIAAKSPEEIRHEAADLLYFTFVKMAAAGVPLAEVVAELDRRRRKVTRRSGNAKQGPKP